MAKKKKVKVGRKPKYEYWRTEEGLLEIEGWARDGANDIEIASLMGIHSSTLYEWQNKFPEIKEALKVGKSPADRKVEKSLYNNAIGYDYKEEQAVKLRRVYYKDGMRHEEERVEVVQLRKHKPADVKAQIFWLNNRKSAEWRDKKEVEVSAKNKLEDFFVGD